MATSNLTAERLRELLVYDSSTGLFNWQVPHGRFGRIPAGTHAGTITPWGYVAVRLDGALYLMHRLAWMHTFGRWPNPCIDHINGQKSDNRLINLREATSSENMQNRLRPQSNNRTGVNGVFFDTARGKFVANVKLNGKRAYGKRFDTFEEACLAVEVARAALHPFAVNHD